MNAQQRRQTILQILQQSDAPVSATALADAVKVSRQCVVGDIALLRAAHMPILATPRGYVWQPPTAAPAFGQSYRICCKHSREQVEEELLMVVDNGGGVLDVTVEHPIYRCV